MRPSACLLIMKGAGAQHWTNAAVPVYELDNYSPPSVFCIAPYLAGLTPDSVMHGNNRHSYSVVSENTDDEEPKLLDT